MPGHHLLSSMWPGQAASLVVCPRLWLGASPASGNTIPTVASALVVALPDPIGIHSAALFQLGSGLGLLWLGLTRSGCCRLLHRATVIVSAPCRGCCCCCHGATLPGGDPRAPPRRLVLPWGCCGHPEVLIILSNRMSEKEDREHGHPGGDAPWLGCAELFPGPHGVGGALASTCPSIDPSPDHALGRHPSYRQSRPRSGFSITPKTSASAAASKTGTKASTLEIVKNVA